MVIVKCDRCGKEIKESNNRFLYDYKYDFCDECQEAYDKIEKEMSAMAIKMREECEKAIKEKANEMIKKCMSMKEEKDEKEII